MAMDQSALLEVLEVLKAADVDERIRQATQTLYQALIDAELTAVIGAGPWERTPERAGERNGSRARTLSTTAGGSLQGCHDSLGAVLCSLDVGVAADHSKRVVELHVNLLPVGQGDLDLIPALLVANLRTGDRAAAGVRERGLTGSGECVAGELGFGVIAAGGRRTRRTRDGGGSRRCDHAVSDDLAHDVPP